MTVQYLQQLFWRELIWGHIEMFHNNASVETLFQRLENGECDVASTFITEEGHEGDIADFVWSVLEKNIAEINALLSAKWSHRCLSDLSVITWNIALPSNISGIVLKEDRKIYISHFARIVLKRDFKGRVVGLTAYPI